MATRSGLSIARTAWKVCSPARVSRFHTNQRAIMPKTPPAGTRQRKNLKQEPDNSRLNTLIKELEDEDQAVRAKAAEAIGALGSKAKSAVPALENAMNPNAKNWTQRAALALWKVDREKYIEILKDKANPNRWAATVGLWSIRAEAKELTPIVLAIAKDPEDSSNCQHALLALGCIGADPKVSVPALIEGMDLGQYARSMASQALAAIGPDARPALPGLRQALTDPDLRVQVEAAHAIWKIEKQAGEVVPILENAAVFEGSDRSGFRYPALSYLGQMGPAAKSAFPTLLKAWQERKDGNKAAMATALKAIDAEAAAKAGVK